jgi:hypothetical protein
MTNDQAPMTRQAPNQNVEMNESARPLPVVCIWDFVTDWPSEPIRGSKKHEGSKFTKASSSAASSGIQPAPNYLQKISKLLSTTGV